MKRKRWKDVDKTGFFIEDGRVCKFTTCRGIRYVHILPIVVEDAPTTTYSCQAKSVLTSQELSAACGN